MRKSILAVFLVFVMVLSLAACSGQDIGSSISSPGTSSEASLTTPADTSLGASSTPAEIPQTNTPAPTPSPTPPVLEAITPQIGIVSVSGAFYKSGESVYSLPEGLLCMQADRSDEHNAFFTLWNKNFRTDKDKTVAIMEHDEQMADFETRTAEEWWQYCYINQPVSQFSNLVAEKTTMDGYPAIRVTDKMMDEAENGDDDVLSSESWIVDTPNGCIVFVLMNLEISSDYDAYTKWVWDIITTIVIGREVTVKLPEASPDSGLGSGLFY